MKKLITILCTFCVVAIGSIAVAQLTKDEVGIEEHLGQPIPLDAMFQAEDGSNVTLGDLIDKPTILALVYFTCPGICSPLLNGMVDVIQEMDLQPGIDYDVVTISFNPIDTFEHAEAKQANYLEALERQVDPSAWRFLVGDQENIRRITDAVGFRYIQEGEDFNHAATLTILSPDGKITRYVRGVMFLSAEVTMALNEAKQGVARPTRNALINFCFSYDPERQAYLPNMLRIVGGLTLLLAAGILGVAIMRRPKPASAESVSEPDAKEKLD